MLAAVDLGSNSFRLLAVVPRRDEWHPLADERLRVGLARGLDGRECLSRDAVARGLVALRRFRTYLRSLAPVRVRAVATDTLRRARNRRSFLEPASRLLGTPVEVISGSEEAALIYAGAVPASPVGSGPGQLVLDIGGGSTEVAVGRGARPLRAESLPLGCIPLTRDHFPDGNMTAERLRAAVRAVRGHAGPALCPVRQHGWERAWGASGTVEAVTGLAGSLGALEVDGTLGPEGVAAVQEALLANPQAGQRAALPGVGAARAGVLPGGFAILAGLMEELGLHGLAPARGALREGLVRELIQGL